MNYLMFFKRLLQFSRRRRPKISLLIPFSSDNPDRQRAFEWLTTYWRNELPHSEIVVGHSTSEIFCKAEALNDAVSRSRGRVLVVLDADTYMPGEVINDTADKILENIDNRLWYVPYRYLYRLTKEVTEEILSSDPTDPLRIPFPPPPEYIDNPGHIIKYGHRYGAMITMFPREAFDELGCFDERFKGWGGEDIALVRALDTLWGKHKTLNGPVFHLWHPFIGKDHRTRMWEGQTSANSNAKIVNEYHKATRHPKKMRKLVDEGCEQCKQE